MKDDRLQPLEYQTPHHEDGPPCASPLGLCLITIGMIGTMWAGEWAARTQHDHFYQLAGVLLFPSIVCLVIAVKRSIVRYREGIKPREAHICVVISVICIALLMLWEIYAA